MVKLRLPMNLAVWSAVEIWKELKILAQRELKQYKLVIILANDYNPAIGGSLVLGDKKTLKLLKQRLHCSG